MKLPPFGKILFDLQQKGLAPTKSIRLYIGNNAWKKANHFNIQDPGTMCLPPWHPPTDYQWPVKQCDILIFDTGYADVEYVEELVYCLYMDGADKVRYLSPDYELTVYHKE